MYKASQASQGRDVLPHLEEGFLEHEAAQLGATALEALLVVSLHALHLRPALRQLRLHLLQLVQLRSALARIPKVKPMQIPEPLLGQPLAL